MYGRNPKRGVERGDGSSLQVQELFHTCQGEGPFAGQAAIFLRLGGCNLACSFCDTEFESFETWPVAQVMARISHYHRQKGTSLVVMTGGEPMRQPIERLCLMLCDVGYKVQIETNGTLYRELPEAVSIVCSPKASGGCYHPLRADMLARVDALKFIIAADIPPYDAVPDVGQGVETPIYVQPMDMHDDVSATRRNIQYTMRLAQQGGYYLSMQLHKLMDVA
ncbi:MAG: 7-carboxy-7-deazaguanine synthase QueE [Sphaerospermopsis sp. SIO1G2]|nr:7-carboxy-7-deazaguanine synthase QueE [Sphaerospermopsis sp. SIO1G2]